MPVSLLMMNRIAGRLHFVVIGANKNRSLRTLFFFPIHVAGRLVLFLPYGWGNQRIFAPVRVIASNLGKAYPELNQRSCTASPIV